MPDFLHFQQSEHFPALLAAILIFMITIFLAVKRWIGFSVTFLLLLFSLAAGFLIDQVQNGQNYFQQTSYPNHFYPAAKDDFKMQITQAVEDLKNEVSNEKENIRLIIDQVQEVIHSVETQKEKLQQFIEETRVRFKNSVMDPKDMKDTGTEDLLKRE